jgi:hypothetical protein
MSQDVSRGDGSGTSRAAGVTRLSKHAQPIARRSSHQSLVVVSRQSIIAVFNGVALLALQTEVQDVAVGQHQY